MELNRDTMKKIAFLAGGTVAFCWALNNLSYLGGIFNTLVGVLSPFLLGLCIAFILSVPMRGFENLFNRIGGKKGKPRNRILSKLVRPICLILSIIFVLTVVAAVIFIVMPELGRTAITIRDSIPGFMEQLQAWGGQILDEFPDIMKTIQGINWNSIWSDVFTFLKSGVGSVLGSTVGVIGSVFNGATTIVLGFIFAMYVLLQRDTLVRQVKKLLYGHIKEARVDRFLEICSLTNRTFSRYITGQCVEALILGSLFFVTMSIFQFPYALMISVLIAFLALIPMFGAIIGMVIGALLILVSNPMQAFWFVILFLVLQQIEGNLIYPRVVGTSVGLPGVWVLVAVTIGGSLFGILGMLVMVPLGSVLYTLLRIRTLKKLKEKKTPVKKYES